MWHPINAPGGALFGVAPQFAGGVSFTFRPSNQSVTGLRYHARLSPPEDRAKGVRIVQARFQNSIAVLAVMAAIALLAVTLVVPRKSRLLTTPTQADHSKEGSAA